LLCCGSKNATALGPSHVGGGVNGMCGHILTVSDSGADCPCALTALVGQAANFPVFGLNNTRVQTSSTSTVTGDLEAASGGSLEMSGSSFVSGTFYKDPTATYTHSGTSGVANLVVQNL